MLRAGESFAVLATLMHYAERALGLDAFHNTAQVYWIKPETSTQYNFKAPSNCQGYIQGVELP